MKRKPGEDDNVGKTAQGSGAGMKWPTVKLHSVTSKVGSGATPRGGDEAYQSTGIPLIRSMNVHFEGFKRKGLAFIDEAQAAQLDNVIVQADDVLFNITGASIGRVTTAPADMAGARVNQHVCILRTTEALLPKFLAYYLATPVQQALVNSNQTGGTRQAITKGMLLSWPVPLPAPKEQRKIVELLEQADGLRQQRAEADKLAERILPALFHKMFGEHSQPKLKTVQDLLGDGSLLVHKDGNFGANYPKKSDFADTGILFVSAMHIDESGFVDLTLAPRLRLEKAETYTFGWTQNGDVLLAHNATVGRVGIVEGAAERMLIGTSLTCFRPDSQRLCPLFLFGALRDHRFQSQLKNVMGQGTRNQVPITAQKRLSLPIADYSLQQDFVRQASAVRTCLHSQMNAAARIDELFKSILHRAFTGELTAKWRQAHLKELLAEMEQQARALRLARPETGASSTKT